LHKVWDGSRSGRKFRRISSEILRRVVVERESTIKIFALSLRKQKRGRI